MWVELTETQRALRDAVRDFATARIAPVAATIDERGAVPRTLLGEIATLGVLGCFVPEAHGGAGLDTVAYALAIEELARASAAVAAIVATHTALVVGPILGFGTEAQQARCLPPLVRGDWIGCSVEDPEGAPAVVARRERGAYVLGGRCRGVPNAPDAQLAVIFAAVDGDGRAAAPFLVEAGSDGSTVETLPPRMGLVGARTGDVVLSACRVGPDGRLGSEGSGSAVAAEMRNVGRLASAALAVGVAGAAFEEALTYAQQRRAFGQALIEFQGLQWRLADMATGLEAARLLVLRAASLRDRGLPYSGEAATARLFAGQTAITVATQAVQMHGGYGYTREFAVERHFRDASVVAGGLDGAAEERLVIAERLVSGELPS